MGFTNRVSGKSTVSRAAVILHNCPIVIIPMIGILSSLGEDQLIAPAVPP